MNTVAADIQGMIDQANGDLPNPPTSLRYEGVNLYEVTGPDGGDVLIAFGALGFEKVLTAVNAYTQNRLGAPEPYAGKDSIQGCLERLTYARVHFVDEGHAEGQEGAFTLDWTKGLTPVTVWML